MLKPRVAARTLWLGLMVLAPGVAAAQGFPAKPLRILTAEAGGGGDFVARLIAQGISGPLGQQVIVDNRGGNLSIELAARAPADGYTLVVNGSAIWLLPFLRDHVAWDALRDFSPVVLATAAPNIVVVHPGLEAKSVRELIAMAAARPGALNYASSAIGGSTHLAAELFKTMAGVNIVCVNYKGNGAAINDLISGRVQVMFAAAAAVAPQVKAGRLRALAVTGAEPSALAPDLATVAASGLPGYEAASLIGMFAAAGTPAAVVNRLNAEVVRVLNRADVKERLFNAGVEAAGGAPEQFMSRIKSEMAKWGKVIKDAGSKAE